MPPSAAFEVPWAPPADLTSLHLQRDGRALDEQLMRLLQQLLPHTAAALCLATDDDREHRVQWTTDASLPLRPGQFVEAGEWPVPETRRLPIVYRQTRIGTVVLGDGIDEAQADAVRALLDHYAVARVNLELGEESRRAAEHYCASLQALQEGIVLFQERDPDAIMARLLALGAAMQGAMAGALYVLDEVGDRGSALRLRQVLGMPEDLLESFRFADGSAFPGAWLDRTAFHLDRGIDPTLGGLATGSLPGILHDLVAVPLRYLDIDVGILLLLNVTATDGPVHERLERICSLGQLGAALIYRLHVEELSAAQRMIQRELQIASTIQQRLMPTEAPEASGFELAWRSVAANNIGGDYVDLIATEAGQLRAIVADVSGHGINSALLMSSFRSSYRAETFRLGDDELCDKLAREVRHEVGTTGMFITAAMLTVAPDRRRVHVTSAGHNPVLLFRAARNDVLAIDAHGPPLGLTEHRHWTGTEQEIRSGDVLLLYTDGVSEATDAELEMYGDDRITDLLRREAASSAQEILRALLDDLRRFTGRDTYDDDLSIAVVKVK